VGKRIKREGSNETVVSSTTTAPHQSQPANHEITGYMPLRHEFETEYENEAESLIKDLQFLDDDPPFDTSLKLAILDIYSNVVDKRLARRAFVLEHGLLDFKRHMTADKARGREEREFYNALKGVSRFLDSSNLQTVLDGLVKEEELRKRISVLQEYRRNGIRSFEEVSVYEAEKKHLVPNTF